MEAKPQPTSARHRSPALKARAAECSPDALSVCSAWGCGRLPQTASGKGLSRRYCTKHVRHYARHGSAHRGSYSAGDLKPYLWAAERWLKAHAGDGIVQAAVKAMAGLLGSAGRPEITTRMLHATAKARARVALARLRTQGVPPERLLTIALATWALGQDDWSFRADTEFRRVQIAKQAHRLAARHMPAWTEGIPKASPALLAVQRFPEATGPVLRELGRMIDHIGGTVAEAALPELLRLKRERWGRHPSHPADTPTTHAPEPPPGQGSRNLRDG